MPLVTPSDGLKCCITTELFVEPVTTVDGHTYERKGISDWILKRTELKLPVTSPATNLALENTKLTPNIQVKKICDEFRSKLLTYEQILGSIQKQNDVKYLRDHSFMIGTSESVLHIAAFEGNLETFIYFTEDCKIKSDKAQDLLFACTRGFVAHRPGQHLLVIKYIVSHYNLSGELKKPRTDKFGFFFNYGN